MSSLPGSCGYPIIGDNTVQFYRDPFHFISSKIAETSSRVFESRLLNAPTVYICSFPETRELLTEKSQDFDFGYRDFLFNCFGDNILFENGEVAAYLKSCMEPVFLETACYQPVIESACKAFVDSLGKRGSAINVYEEFKSLMTRLCLELFLGFSDNSEDVIESISSLTTLHWHGIIALPINVRLPYFGNSTWRKALFAKEQLLKVIRSTADERKNIRKRGNSKSNRVSHREEEEKSILDRLLGVDFRNPHKEVEQHLLLFVSALIPKAFASIITSFVLQTAGDSKMELRARANNDQDFHNGILLEVQRLWPPFLGGRRIANKHTTIGKYSVPKGHAAVYLSYFAHRDDSVFSDPDSFKPDRWLDSELADRQRDCLFTFGGGPRRCIGVRLIQRILTYLTKEMLEKYSWTIENTEENFDYKLLPVARPTVSPEVMFRVK